MLPPPNELMGAFGFCVSRISTMGKQRTASELTGMTVGYDVIVSVIYLMKHDLIITYFGSE